MMNKILILSCNTGAGHNSVAKAIEDLYWSHGEHPEIIDALSFLPQGWSEITSDIHSYIYRNKPDLFRKGYRIADNHRKQFKKGHVTRNLLDIGVSKLGSYINVNQYTHVIACHVFAGLMLTDAITKFKLNIVSGIVETDYTVTPGTEKCNLNWHFVPSEKQKTQLVGYGICENSIVVTGIPVRSQFYYNWNKSAAKYTLMINPSLNNIVIACGSMGCGNIEEIVNRLAVIQNKKAFSITVLCGTNKTLSNMLNKEYANNRNIHVFDNVSNMSMMLDSADVYITKPGGISITEAALKKIPMVFIDAVGGCEQYNLDFFVNAGGAVTSTDIERVAQIAVDIMESEHKKHLMSKALSTVSEKFNSELIYETMNSIAI